MEIERCDATYGEPLTCRNLKYRKCVFSPRPPRLCAILSFRRRGQTIVFAIVRFIFNSALPMHKLTLLPFGLSVNRIWAIGQDCGLQPFDGLTPLTDGIFLAQRTRRTQTWKLKDAIQPGASH
jgi:hypothetical protein